MAEKIPFFVYILHKKLKVWWQKITKRHARLLGTFRVLRDLLQNNINCVNIIRWEELLLFNEDPEYLKSTFAANWGIFFEIMDFVRMSSVNNESWRTKDPHTTGNI